MFKLMEMFWYLFHNRYQCQEQKKLKNDEKKIMIEFL